MIGRYGLGNCLGDGAQHGRYDSICCNQDRDCKRKC